MTQHRTLVRSSLLATTATVSLIAVNGANAGLTLYTSEADLVNDMMGFGASLDFLEDFEDHEPLGEFGYQILNNPLDSNPNGPFTNGIVEGLTVRGNGGGIIVSEPGPYSGMIDSSVVGTFQSPATLSMEFADGALGVGFDIWGIETFIDGVPTDVEYTVYDTDGGVLGSGSVETPDTEFPGQFFGVAAGDLIGSIEIRGLRFGADTTEYVDNVQSWSVPAPGALALLGLAGLGASRRRRA